MSCQHAAEWDHCSLWGSGALSVEATHAPSVRARGLHSAKSSFANCRAIGLTQQGANVGPLLPQRKPGSLSTGCWQRTGFSTKAVAALERKQTKTLNTFYASGMHLNKLNGMFNCASPFSGSGTNLCLNSAPKWS